MSLEGEIMFSNALKTFLATVRFLPRLRGFKVAANRHNGALSRRFAGKKWYEEVSHSEEEKRNKK